MLVGVREKRLAGDTVRQGQRSCQECRVEITYFNPHFCISELPTISRIILIEVFP